MKYKYVLVRQPYNFYDTNPRAKRLISDAFALKLSGYKKAHKQVACPISTHDFFVDHILILDQYDQVVSAYNLTSPEMAAKYNSTFVLIDTIKDSFSSDDLGYVNDYISSRPNVGYNYAWCMSSKLPKEDRKLVRDLSIASLFYYYQENNIDTIIDVNVLSLKVDKMKEWMGYSHFDRELPDIMAYGSKCNMMYNEAQNFSPEFMEIINAYKDQWELREEISEETEQDLKVAA
jgi:hypothetical protein